MVWAQSLQGLGIPVLVFSEVLLATGRPVYNVWKMVNGFRGACPGGCISSGRRLEQTCGREREQFAKWYIFLGFPPLPASSVIGCVKAVIVSRALGSSLPGGTSVCKLTLWWRILDVNIFAQGPCWILWLSLEFATGEAVSLEMFELLYRRSNATCWRCPSPSCISLRGRFQPHGEGAFNLTVLLFPHRSNMGMTVIALKINEMESKIKSLLTVVWHSVFVFVFFNLCFCFHRSSEVNKTCYCLWMFSQKSRFFYFLSCC